MKSPLIQSGEALMLSLVVACDQSRKAEAAHKSAVGHAESTLEASLNARRAVASAEQAIRDYAESTPVASVEVNPNREAFYGQALKSGVMPWVTPPALGEYWAGQGGLYGGLRHYPEGLCHIIFANVDVGKHAFGEQGTDVEDTCQIDGRSNTAILVNRDGSHPAAEAAYAYTCDGHNDFYLPSSGELHHGYLYLPESFEKDWYVSSSQRSACDAFLMDFDDGHQYYYGKGDELRVRPVRRLLQ